jgi:hypothetical protein
LSLFSATTTGDSRYAQQKDEQNTQESTHNFFD